MSDEFRKVAGGSRVVREPDSGGGKPKGKLEFASPVDVNVVGPTDEQIAAAERAGGRVKKTVKDDPAGK